MIALGWIRGEPQRWKQFVANRVTEIQMLTTPSDWSHCPGEENPADPTTRGLSAEMSGRVAAVTQWSQLALHASGSA